MMLYGRFKRDNHGIDIFMNDDGEIEFTSHAFDFVFNKTQPLCTKGTKFGGYLVAVDSVKAQLRMNGWLKQ